MYRITCCIVFTNLIAAVCQSYHLRIQHFGKLVCFATRRERGWLMQQTSKKIERVSSHPKAFFRTALQ